MLINLSQDQETTKEKIDLEVGKAYELDQQKELGKTESGLLKITSANTAIFNLLILNQGISTGSIEIRPDGIIIRLPVVMDTYALIIPYYKLKIHKGQPNEYTLYRDNYFLKFMAEKQNTHDFFKKIRQLKAYHWSSDKPY